MTSLYISLLYFTPQLVEAQEPSKVQKAAESALTNLINTIFIGIFGYIAGLGGALLNLSFDQLVFGMGSTLGAGTGEIINRLWGVIRDIFNIALIFGVIWAGLSTILMPERTATKKMIAGIVIAALVVNFSLFVTKAIIDFANIAAIQIYQLFGTGPQAELNFGIAGAFINELGLVTVANGSSLTLQNLTTGGGIVYAIGSAIFLLIAAYVFLAGAIMMIVRFVVLIFLMIFSPIMVLGLIFPQFKGLTSKWFSTLIGQAFFAPAYLFLLYLSLNIITAVKGAVAGGSSLGQGMPGVENVSIDSFGATLYFVILCGFMVASLHIAKKISFSGGSHATAIGAGLGAGISRRTSGYAGRKIIGGGSNWLLQKYDRNGGSSRTLRNILSGGAEAKYGGKYSYKDDMKFKKEVAGRHALKEGRQKLNSAITDGTSARATSNDRILMEEKLEKASAEQLVDMAKTKEGRELLAQVAGSITQSKFEKILEDKENLSDEFKAELKKGRQESTVNNIINQTNNVTAAGTPRSPDDRLREGVRKASVDELTTLDFGSHLMPSAMHLQDSQMGELKKKFGAEKYRLLSEERESQMLGASIADVVGSRRGNKEIAKLPNSILEGVGFATYMASTPSGISVDLLKTIARESGADKRLIGTNIRNASGTTLSRTVEDYFDSPQGAEFNY